MHKIFLITTASLLFFLTACSQKEVALPEPLQLVADTELEIPVYDEEGIQYYLERNDDKIHVVNFWATWCKPCVEELPEFEKLNAEYKNKGVEVTLISMDFEEQFESKLLPYVKQNLKSNVVVVVPEDENGFPDKVDKNWNGALPATLIYDKNKRYFISGKTDYEELLEQIKKFGLPEVKTES